MFLPLPTIAANGFAGERMGYSQALTIFFRSRLDRPISLPLEPYSYRPA